MRKTILSHCLSLALQFEPLYIFGRKKESQVDSNSFGKREHSYAVSSMSAKEYYIDIQIGNAILFNIKNHPIDYQPAKVVTQEMLKGIRKKKSMNSTPTVETMNAWNEPWHLD